MFGIPDLKHLPLMTMQKSLQALSHGQKGPLCRLAVFDHPMSQSRLTGRDKSILNQTNIQPGEIDK